MADKHYIFRLPWGGASCNFLDREDSKEHLMSHATDRILSDFGKSVMALAERLDDDPHFGLIEQVFIENHIHIIQSTYSTWKRRHLRKASGE